MSNMMDEMYDEMDKKSKKVSSDDMTAVEGFADQIKKHCAGSGEDLNHVMNQVSSLVLGKEIEEDNDEMNKAKGDMEEGSTADDKAPKKALIVAMLKKKNSEG